ncbi:MAG: nucleotidyl transferase AbiEii/AbiGii toxin family protein [Candidatus Daviesbacteria bacterium]|nr:nucleotidyl transferase AbiEii/AbiGii toxin family protein [Candidatus Daviesbacteria bacterium]
MRQEALTEKAKEILPALRNFNNFYLAGGTALALQIGHRISVDFDLFSEKEIDKNLFPKVRKIFYGNKIELSVNNPDELTVFIDGLKITFLKYPFPLIFDLVDYEGIGLLNVKEIAATKAYTINRRGSFKDYADLFFIVSKKHATLEEIIEISGKKYDNEFNSRLFLEQLIYLEDIEEAKIEFLKESATKKEIEALFIEEIKRIKI